MRQAVGDTIAELPADQYRVYQDKQRNRLGFELAKGVLPPALQRQADKSIESGIPLHKGDAARNVNGETAAKAYNKRMADAVPIPTTTDTIARRLGLGGTFPASNPLPKTAQD
jgi:hypothetical protein